MESQSDLPLSLVPLEVRPKIIAALGSLPRTVLTSSRVFLLFVYEMWVVNFPRGVTLSDEFARAYVP